MSKSSLKVFLAVAFCYRVRAAVTEVAWLWLSSATPSTLCRTALEHPNVLKGARLNNDTGRRLLSSGDWLGKRLSERN